MSLEYAGPNLDDLRAEQKVVQADKFQGRMLLEYSEYLFPGQHWRKPQGNDVADFMRPHSSDANRVSLENVLDGLSETNDGQPMHWADMGGGRALTMRQLATMPRFAGKLTMTNVDLFDYGLEGLSGEELGRIETAYPGITTESSKPNLLLGDIENSVVSKHPDLITSVESVQYLNDPLRAMTSWYNQLNDNGFMMIAGEGSWPSWIRYEEDESTCEHDSMPIDHILRQFGAAGVRYAAMAELDYESGYRPKLDTQNVRSFVVQKEPGTRMRLNTAVAKVWTNPWNYKAVYYEKPTDNSSIIEVVSAD